MSDFDAARKLYRDAKQVIDVTRDLAVTNDALRWAREDLEDVLLDLKLAVIEINEAGLDELIRETRAAIAAVRRELFQ
jgi:hypothetical protein